MEMLKKDYLVIVDKGDFVFKTNLEVEVDLEYGITGDYEAKKTVQKYLDECGIDWKRVQVVGMDSIKTREINCKW